MCYAVTSMPVVTGSGLNLEDREEFESLEAAQTMAEEHLLAGRTSVRIWKLHSTARIEKKVVWE